MSSYTFFGMATLHANGLPEGDMDDWAISVMVETNGLYVSLSPRDGRGDKIYIEPDGRISVLQTFAGGKYEEIGVADSIRTAVEILQDHRALQSSMAP